MRGGLEILQKGEREPHVNIDIVQVDFGPRCDANLGRNRNLLNDQDGKVMRSRIELMDWW